MKHCFFTVALITLLSCNQHPATTSSLPADTTDSMTKDSIRLAAGEYRLLPSLISHLTEKETGINDPVRNVQEQDDFCSQAPLMDGGSWQQADKAYREYVRQHADHQYINVFRQYGAYIILVKLHLLAASTPEAPENIAFYADELITSNSINAALISSALRQLEAHGFSATKIRELAVSAEKQLQNNSGYAALKKSLQQSVNQAISATRDPKYAADDENMIRVYRLTQEGEATIHALAAARQ
ncbi:hypothetical protein SAMN04488128_10477 [Chitinophaga eiseniae]|uniref:DUF4375 domain-containing protein n=1 Tax=Chitinophaga eiseniae TaxID=634771 RepID=A0A1T4T725_9BACT|nr:hypothetical protein [Chitinophaga eiseniae]SKA36282.1 hypothetical protein SAMN04488128_10477 [Chitinophaga eiseniae]